MLCFSNCFKNVQSVLSSWLSKEGVRGPGVGPGPHFADPALKHEPRTSSCSTTRSRERFSRPQAPRSLGSSQELKERSFQDSARHPAPSSACLFTIPACSVLFCFSPATLSLPKSPVDAPLPGDTRPCDQREGSADAHTCDPGSRETRKMASLS